VSPVPVETTTYDDPVFAALAVAQEDELRARYGGESEPGVKPSAEDVLLAVVIRDDDGVPVACGALRVLDDEAVELKRMYVVPTARGRGLARAVLARVEDEARARGFAVARLETGSWQLDAIALYTSSGYHEIPLFGAYVGAPESRCFERSLSC
jgi:GNAT superfamily N-acetyltransferase